MPSDIILALEEANQKIREMVEGNKEIRDIIIPGIVTRMARLEEENRELRIRLGDSNECVVK
jgi:hypothetical protein